MKNGPITPALLLEAIHGAEQADPVKLRALLASLRDQEARRELLQQGLAAASAALAPEPAPAAPPPPWLPPALAAEPPGEAGGGPAEESRQSPVSATSRPPVLPAEPPPSPPPRALAPTPAPGLTSAPPAAQSPWGELLSPLSATENSQPLPHAALPTGQCLPKTLFARLMALQRERHRLAALLLDERLALAKSFPQGWQRRRAVQALLVASPHPGVEEIHAMLATLAAERDRLWCASQLPATGHVREPQLDQLLALIDSPCARRRLALRQAAVETRGQCTSPPSEPVATPPTASDHQHGHVDE